MGMPRLWKTLEAVRDSRGDLQTLVDGQYEFRFSNEDLSDVVAGVLAFQRNWMGFTIPSLLGATQRIYNELAGEYGEPSANYDFYAGQVESLFVATGVLDLDEYGLPLPLALRFAKMGMRQAEDVGEVLESFVALAHQESVRSTLSDVEAWIVDDVLAGLGRSGG